MWELIIVSVVGGVVLLLFCLEPYLRPKVDDIILDPLVPIYEGELPIDDMDPIIHVD